MIHLQLFLPRRRLLWVSLYSLLFCSFLFGCIAFALPASAQDWFDNLTPKERNNIFSIQRAYEQLQKTRAKTPIKEKANLQGEEKEEGEGDNLWKRWEHEALLKASPNGTLPEPGYFQREWERYARERAQVVGGIFTKNTAKVTEGGWNELGPRILDTRSFGNAIGAGRVNCIRFHPTNSAIIWIGTPSSGAWRTTDGGTNWTHMTAAFVNLGVSDIALAPDGATLYLATGDADGLSNFGTGVLKSTDGGTTWVRTASLVNVQLMYRLIIHPTNPNILLAGSTAGIHKTTNGGATWQVVRSFQNFPNDRITDLEFHPTNPSIVYAGNFAGQILRSTNTGDAWSVVTSGVPAGGRRTSIAVSAANPNIVYALMETNNRFLGLLRSNDAGVSWSLRSSTPNLLSFQLDGSGSDGQGFYTLALGVSPLNADEIYVGGVVIWKSINGGVSWGASSLTSWFPQQALPIVHADHHDLVFQPGSNILFSGNDGGIARSNNSGVSWTISNGNLGIAQFYALGGSKSESGTIIAAAQDNGAQTMRGTLNWSVVQATGDGTNGIVDPVFPDSMYFALQKGVIRRTRDRGVTSSLLLLADGDAGARQNLTGSRPTTGEFAPFITSAFAMNTFYAQLFVGHQSLWTSKNRGTTWTKTALPTQAQGSPLDLLVINSSNATVSANVIAATMYTGSGISGGKLFRSFTNGDSWTEISRPPTQNTITNLALHPSVRNSFTLWATVSGTTAGDKVYESNDGGGTWRNISGPLSGLGTLPNVPIHCIIARAIPAPRLVQLIIGTELGVFYSNDRGATGWKPFNDGMPVVPIRDLEIFTSTTGSQRLQAATFGRGVWESTPPQTATVLLAAASSKPGASLTEAEPRFALAAPTNITRTSPNANAEFPFNIVPVNDSTGVLEIDPSTLKFTLETRNPDVTTGQGFQVIGTGTERKVILPVKAISGQSWVSINAVTPSGDTTKLYFTAAVNRKDATMSISPIPDLTTFPGIATSAIFTVPQEFASAEITYSAQSSNTNLISAPNVVVTTDENNVKRVSVVSGVIPTLGDSNRVETGESMITLVAQHSFGLSSTASFRVFVVAPPTIATGVQQKNEFSVLGLAVYPNPAQERAIIEYTLPQAGNVAIALYNTLGQNVATLFEGTQAAGHHTIPINLRTLANGAYICRVAVGGRSTEHALQVVR